VYASKDDLYTSHLLDGARTPLLLAQQSLDFGFEATYASPPFFGQNIR
jgi:hypothetical protein